MKRFLIESKTANGVPRLWTVYAHDDKQVMTKMKALWFFPSKITGFGQCLKEFQQTKFTIL